MSDAWFGKNVAPDGVTEDGCHPSKRRHRKTTTTERNTPTKQRKPSTAYQGPKRPRCRYGLLWRNLPSFGHMWADEHKRDNWRGTLASSDPADRAQLQTLHIKKAGIEARLTVADVGRIPLDWGYECIADALERHDAVLDFEIPAAAEWITIAGERLYAGAVAGEESWALERRRDYGMEGRAMSLERWTFWERRLEELAEREGAARGAAERAVREMKALMMESRGGG